MDFTDYGALKTLEWALNVGSPSPPSALFAKLHIGDPGADGIDNPAVNTERQQLSFAAPANTGTDGRAQALTNASAVWVDLPQTETYTHISLWDLSTGGNAWYKGELGAPVPVLAGAAFAFVPGQSIDHT